MSHSAEAVVIRPFVENIPEVLRGCKWNQNDSKRVVTIISSGGKD